MKIAMPVGRPVRLSLADDVELITAGLTVLLEPYSDHVCLVSGSDPTQEPPDVVLLDPALHDRAVSSAAPRFRTEPAVVVYNWDADQATLLAAMRDGARGVLHKGLCAKDVVLAIEHVHSGKIVVALEGEELEVRDPAPVPSTARPAEWLGSGHGLTQRESEVVALISSGCSNREISERLYFSINTVKSYIRGAYRKMGVSTRSQAVLWGLSHGFGSQYGRSSHRLLD